MPRPSRRPFRHLPLYVSPFVSTADPCPCCFPFIQLPVYLSPLAQAFAPVPWGLPSFHSPSYLSPLPSTDAPLPLCLPFFQLPSYFRRPILSKHRDRSPGLPARGLRSDRRWPKSSRRGPAGSHRSTRHRIYRPSPRQMFRPPVGRFSICRNICRHSPKPPRLVHEIGRSASRPHIECRPATRFYLAHAVCRFPNHPHTDLRRFPPKRRNRGRCRFSIHPRIAGRWTIEKCLVRAVCHPSNHLRICRLSLSVRLARVACRPTGSPRTGPRSRCRRHRNTAKTARPCHSPCRHGTGRSMSRRRLPVCRCSRPCSSLYS